MRVLYCDPGLITHVGHWATHCKILTSAFQRLGHRCYVLANASVTPQLAQRYHALPLFSCSPYAQTSRDEFCGWLRSFFDVAEIVSRDMARINDVRTDDFIFFDAATPAMLHGLTTWMARSGPYGPKVAVSLIEQTGMIGTHAEGGTKTLKAINYNPTLYRYAASAMPAPVKERISFVTVDKTFAEIYSFMLNEPVRYVPHPYESVVAKKSTSSRSSEVTIGFIGAQRPNKRFQDVPEIVRGLLTQTQGTRFIVQDGRHEMVGVLEELRVMAVGEPRLELVFDPVTDDAWADVLSRIDILVAPYDVRYYATACSGISCEAIANGIPLVAPAGTTLARLLGEFGSPGLIYTSAGGVHEVVEAVVQCLDQLDLLRTRCVDSQRRWSEVNGAINLVRSIIKDP